MYQDTISSHCTYLAFSCSCNRTHLCSQGFSKLTKSCTHFQKILLNNTDIKSCLYRKQWQKLGYSIQGLIAKGKELTNLAKCVGNPC